MINISAYQFMMIISLFGMFLLLVGIGAAFAVYKSRNPDGLPFLSSPFKTKDPKPTSYMGEMFKEEAFDTTEDLSEAADRIRDQKLPDAIRVAMGEKE